MVFKSFNIEEDSRKYREFMESDQFKAAVRALQHYETDHDGLTPAEVWNEVNHIIADLKTFEAEDRETFILQLFGNEKRRLKNITRDDEAVEDRDKQDVNRSLTCIFYCLCLRLERTSKVPENNPHNELLDVIVEELIHINHPILPLLYHDINKAGDELLARKHKELQELDPMKTEDEAAARWHKVVEHYSNRLWKHVKTEKRTAYNNIWNALQADEEVIAIMAEAVPVMGDERLELAVDYNAKAVFNLIGLLFDYGFFTINRPTPLAREATEHYDKKTKDKTSAKYEYFTPESAGRKAQFIGLTADQMQHLKDVIELLI